MRPPRLVLLFCAAALIGISLVAVSLIAESPAGPAPGKDKTRVSRPHSDPARTPEPTKEDVQRVKQLADDLAALEPEVCEDYTEDFLEVIELTVDACKAEFAAETPIEVRWEEPLWYPSGKATMLGLTPNTDSNTTDPDDETTVTFVKEDEEWKIAKVEG